MEDNSSYKKKTIHGLIWSVTDLLANKGFQFIIQVVLARLLLPEHFGLIGMLMLFIALSNAITDSGFSEALIRETKVKQSSYSTVFYFNIFISVFIYIALFLIAPLISEFFNEPMLVAVLRIYSLIIIISSVGIIQRVILVKEVNFKLQMKINIIAGIFSGIIAIYCALIGLEIWSLVIRSLLMQTFQTILLWIFNRWRPSYTFKFSAIKALFNFSYKILISRLIETIYNNIYYVLIGKYYSVAQLGYYTNASKLVDVTSESIAFSIQRVTYPVLSNFKSDEEKLKSGFKQIIRFTSLVNFPVIFLLITIAHPLILLIFGEKWLPSVQLFQLLCLVGLFFPLHAINLNILQVKGRSDLFLLLEVIKKIILTLLLIVVLYLKLGIVGLIVAAFISSFISYLINIYFAGKELSYSSYEQMKDTLPTLLIASFMALITFSLGIYLPDILIFKILIQILSGVFIYILLLKIFKINEFTLLSKIIISKYRAGRI